MERSGPAYSKRTINLESCYLPNCETTRQKGSPEWNFAFLSQRRSRAAASRALKDPGGGRREGNPEGAKTSRMRRPSACDSPVGRPKRAAMGCGRELASRPACARRPASCRPTRPPPSHGTPGNVSWHTSVPRNTGWETLI